MKERINIFAVVMLLLLPGCGGTLVDFTKETFPQGKALEDRKPVIKRYLKDVHIYDQFTTLALFDALWLSDEIRTLYTDTYVQMLGKDHDARDAFLRRQLKANAHFITFYVLSTHEVPLTVKPVKWAMHIEVDGKKYLPFQTKVVELPVQYRMFFGKAFNKHKQAYEVKFERHDSDDKDILSENKAHTLKMIFSSATHVSETVWNINKSGKVPCKKTVKKASPRVRTQKPSKKKRSLKKAKA